MITIEGSFEVFERYYKQELKTLERLVEDDIEVTGMTNFDKFKLKLKTKEYSGEKLIVHNLLTSKEMLEAQSNVQTLFYFVRAFKFKQSEWMKNIKKEFKTSEQRLRL